MSKALARRRRVQSLVLVVLVLAVVSGGLAWKIFYSDASFFEPAAPGDTIYGNVPQAVETETITAVPKEESVITFHALQPSRPKTVGDITTYTFDTTNFVNVVPVAMQSALLSETSILATTPVQVSGQSGKKLTLSSAKDGSKITIIQVIIDDTLYDIRGSDDFLNTIDTYIEFKKN